jgi:hypothetical protein
MRADLLLGSTPHYQSSLRVTVDRPAGTHVQRLGEDGRALTASAAATTDGQAVGRRHGRLSGGVQNARRSRCPEPARTRLGAPGREQAREG